MTSAQLLLRYQALVDRERALKESIEQSEVRLAADPAVVEKQEVLAGFEGQREVVAERLRDSDREREAHRSRLHARERELMSGKIRNPTDLLQMSDEVKHMKARFAEEEEAQLTLMEEAETADESLRRAQTELAEVRKQSESEEPALREELDEWRSELTEVESEKDAVWQQIPPRDQAMYSRVRVRPSVAQVTNNQCSACRVTVTSSGMQLLRKGELVQCEHCGRVLVVA